MRDKGLILLGRRMEYDDPKFLGFMAAIRRNMEEGLSAGIVGFLPWLRNILPKSFTKIDLIQESIDTTYNYFKARLFLKIYFNSVGLICFLH